MIHKLCAISLLIVLFGATGCTRSFLATYKVGQPVLVPGDSRVTIAVAKFVDKRSFVRPSDKKSVAYIATQGPWQFGLTYKGTSFTPVSDLLQDAAVDELNAAGFVALKQQVSGAPSDYVLGGEVINFEFANDAGMWRVTSRRAVTINLELRKFDGSPVFASQLINETDTENEGMGVLHTTNVEKLINGALKRALTKTVDTVAEALQLKKADIKIYIRTSDGALLAAV